jgi:hypothetical protein
VTETRLYFAIGIPAVTNAALIGLLIAQVNSRFEAVNHRFDDMRHMWLAEFHRVEGVLDARLKHLEDERR